MTQESIYVPGETYTSARATPELVGREKELEQIEGAIRDTEHSYIVYITGQGGIGKTRLGRHVLECPPEDVPKDTLLVASDLMDLYHTSTRTVEGLIDTIQRMLSPDGKGFERYQEERETLSAYTIRPPDKVEKLRQQREDMVSAFQADFNGLARQHRIVLVLDTAEKLFLQEDLAAQRLGLTEERSAILDWLIKDFLPQAHNVVVLMAGRPGPGGLERELARIPDKQFLSINLPGITESEALQYFEAVIKSATGSDDPRDAQSAEAVQRLSEKDRQTIFHCLRDEGDPPTIRPILLALTIDYLVVAGQPLSALTQPLKQVRALSAGQRQSLREELGRELVQTIHQHRRPADEVILALGWLRKGADRDILARIAGLEPEKVEAALDNIRDLSFVKTRPADNRVFLHDEMYDLLQRHALDRVSDAQRERVFNTLQAYYQECIEQALDETAELHRPLAESALPDPAQVIAVRARWQDALVEDLHYRLRRDAAQGFQTYFRYAEEAIAAADGSLDMQLRAELLGFLAERDPSGRAEAIDGLRRADVVADAAVRWIKRLINDGQYDKALKVVQRLRTDVRSLVEAGGKLAEAELNVWESLAAAYMGEIEQAELVLLEAIEILKDMPHSVQWAGILARAYNNLGYVRRVQGRYHSAIHIYEKALPLWRAARIKTEQANTLNNHAFALARVGAFDAAWQQAWEGLELRERLGPATPMGLSLNTLAHIRIQSNDLRGAQNLAEQAVKVFSALDDSRGLGLSYIALAEAKRRISSWDTYFPLESANWLEEAVCHVEAAESIFRENVKEPSRLVEALIEVGCAYREWANLRQSHPDILAKGERNAHQYTARELAQLGWRALQEAVDLAEQQEIFYQQVDALVNLAWLRYYTELYVGATDFDAARKSIEQDMLAQITRIIPSNYWITERKEGQGGLPCLDSESVIVPFLVQLGKMELLRGEIALNCFARSGNKDTDALKQAVEHYTLSLAYDTLFISDQIFRDMRRAMKQIRNRLKSLDEWEKVMVYDTVAEIEEKCGLGKSRMMRFLREHFGARESLVSIQL